MVKSLYIIGESRTNLDNAITAIYSSFYIAFEVNPETDEILDMGVSHTLTLTERFLQKIFIGKRITDCVFLRNTVRERYHGSSQKAILVSYGEALKKYESIKKEFYNK